MSEISEEQIENIAIAVGKYIDKKTEDFYVDRQKHWKHHEAMDKVIEFFENTRGIIWKSFLIGMIGFVFMIFAVGFTIWIKTAGGSH